MKFKNRIGAPEIIHVRGLSPKNEPIRLTCLGCRGGGGQGFRGCSHCISITSVSLLVAKKNQLTMALGGQESAQNGTKLEVTAVICLMRRRKQELNFEEFFFVSKKNIEARTFCIVSLDPELLLLYVMLLSTLASFGAQNGTTSAN